METISKYREFLKDSIRKRIDFSQTDQQKGIPVPPLEKSADELLKVTLPSVEKSVDALSGVELATAIAQRKSRRRFTDAYLNLEELSFLLWSTQGIKDPERHPHLRTVPSAGARHSFETYLLIHRVEKLPPGCYRYLPLTHELALHYEFSETSKKSLINAVFGQRFIADAAAVFIWSTLPYRMEWRYLQAAHRVILMDAGHVCQNLYLACEAMGAGTCGVAAYDQEAMDQLLRLDGEDHFTLYLAPVGKV